MVDHDGVKIYTIIPKTTVKEQNKELYIADEPKSKIIWNHKNIKSKRKQKKRIKGTQNRRNI